MHKINVPKEGFTLYKAKELSAEEQKLRSNSFFELMNERRSIREFSDKPIPEGVLENIIKTASTAPSGAHKQPWIFAVITSPEMKSRIRAAAEKEEFENYNGRMSDEWLTDLAKFETNWKKPYLETAPALVVLLKKSYDIVDGGEIAKNYYVNESVGIAAGIFIAAVHNAGLVTLTHTPSPMNFLTEILNRPKNEKPFLLLPVGYPASETQVPTLKRKSLNEVMVTY